MYYKLLLLLIPVSVLAESVSFIPPTEREDGTPLAPAEIKEYRIYVNGIHVRTIRPDENPATLKGLISGENTVQMMTIDTNDKRSVLSNTYRITWTAPPKPPTL